MILYVRFLDISSNKIATWDMYVFSGKLLGYFFLLRLFIFSVLVIELFLIHSRFECFLIIGCSDQQCFFIFSNNLGYIRSLLV